MHTHNSTIVIIISYISYMHLSSHINGPYNYMGPTFFKRADTFIKSAQSSTVAK